MIEKKTKNKKIGSNWISTNNSLINSNQNKLIL